MQLSVFQDAFSAALQAPLHAVDHAPSFQSPHPADARAHAARHPTAPSPAWLQDLLDQPGFAVYRNSGRKACIDALRANFPSVEILVGEAWFYGAAQAYVDEQPPCDGRLMNYGHTFPDFLRHFPPAAELPYLPAVADLDLAWTQSHLAADAEVLSAGWMATLTAETFAAARLAPHPAAQWRWCAEHPAFTIWQRQRTPGHQHADVAIAWCGEGALLTRPEGAVQWCALPAAGLAFLNACAKGWSLADAAASAMAAIDAGEKAREEQSGQVGGEGLGKVGGDGDAGAPPMDLPALIALLLNAGALCIPLTPMPISTSTATPISTPTTST